MMTNNTPGYLMTFEGIDGCGKTTQVADVAKVLKDEGFEVITTREPGGTKAGRSIRDVLFDLRDENLHPKAEFFLFLADRVQHVEDVIKPALDDGKIILCDRFFDSTWVYQVILGKIPVGYYNKLHNFILKHHGSIIKPDATVFLDLTPEIASERMKLRYSLSRFDQKDAQYHLAVRRAFVNLVYSNKDRFIRVDAGGMREVVTQNIVDVVKRKLKSRNIEAA